MYSRWLCPIVSRHGRTVSCPSTLLVLPRATALTRHFGWRACAGNRKGLTYQTESEQIASVDCHEGLLSQTRVAVKHVSKNASRSESERHVGEAIGQHRADPVCLVVHCSSKAIEANSAKENNNDHKHKTKLGLIDTVVPVRKFEANPVVQWSRDSLADDAEDEL